MPAELSSGAIAQGSVFSLFGSELSTSAVQADSLPLPRNLAGVRVEVIADGVVYEAQLFYVSPLQINGVLPSDAAVGPASVRVIRDGVGSNLAAIKVVRIYPGIYARTDPSYEPAYQNLRQVAVAQRPGFGGSQNLRQDRAAAPGGIVTLWATGLGGAVPVSTSSRDDVPFRVVVGGKEAEILFAGRTSCCIALDQINIRLAPDTPEGCFVPVQVLGGGLPSNVAVIPVAASGEVCPGRETSLTRLYLDRRHEGDNAPVDRARAFHGREWYDPNEIPPVGSCTASDLAGVRVQQPIGEPLVNVEAPEATFELSDGGGPLLFSANAATLGPGAYHVTSQGGTFPNYEAHLNVQDSKGWSNLLSEQDAARSIGLHLEWETPTRIVSAPTEIVTIVSMGGRFVCRVDFNKGNFTVGPEILSLLPEVQATWSFGTMTTTPLQFETDGPETGRLVYRESFAQVFRLDRPRLPTSTVTLPSGDAIHAELATASAEKQRGLMHRPSLSTDRGMLFFFDSPGLYGFWMSQTLIPLDIIWLDTERRIVTISADTPPCPSGVNCPIYSPSAPAQFVLELAAGEAARSNLQLGQQLDW